MAIKLLFDANADQSLMSHTKNCRKFSLQFILSDSVKSQNPI
jgi:hypothetical protein